MERHENVLLLSACYWRPVCSHAASITQPGIDVNLFHSQRLGWSGEVALEMRIKVEF